MKYRKKFSRRAFLQATGASPLLLPLLEPGLARAGCLTNAPKRAVFVLWGNGMCPGNDKSQWPSAANETDFTFPAGLKSLEPYKSDLLFIDKVNYQFMTDTVKLDEKAMGNANGHACVQGWLTGRRYEPIPDTYEWFYQPTGPSIDQHLGKALAARGFAGIPSLYLGVRMYNPVYAVWSAAHAPVAPDSDPGKIFNKLFAGRTGGPPDPELERLQRARKSVLDSVKRDFDRFSRVLGTADKARIERHQESIRTIEKELFAAREQLACMPPNLDLSLQAAIPDRDSRGTSGEDGGTYNTMLDAMIPAVLKLHMDLVVAALATDVTRVVVVQLSDTRDHEWTMPWLGLTESHHLVAHANGTYGNAGKAKADEWLFRQWAYLIGQLKNEKEGSKSVLDSSVVTFLNNMPTGGHEWQDVPAFVAGNCGNYFRTGRAIRNRAPNQVHQPLLVSVANAIGVPLTSWGDPEYNSGEMPGLRG